MHIYIDRSRLETKQNCRRKGFWNYHYKGRGIRLAREIPPPWYFLTGTHTHNGIEKCLKGARPAEAALDSAIEYTNEVTPLFVDIEEGEAKQTLLKDLQEQVWLTVALVYGWAKHRMPHYLTQYKPLDIEREEEITFQVGDDTVTLMTRTDMLSEIIGGNGNNIIHNLKTTGEGNKYWRQQWRYDQQTLTEYIAVENRIGKQVTGTVIEGLVKGKKSEYPEGSNQWRHNNMMVYCWVKEDGLGGFDCRARYTWTCNEAHPVSRGKECPGGQNHRLSGYRKEPVETVFPGGIIGWIDHLLTTDSSVLDQYFIAIEPISRSDWEVERWKRQTLANELEDVRKAEEVDRLVTIEPDTAAILLDHYFPMSTGHGNCIRPGQCQYHDVCWGTADVDDRSMFKLREANHPKESEQWVNVNV